MSSEHKSDSQPSLWPREHGAISMLVQPLVCAGLIAMRWHWSFIPTAVVAISVFLIRAPLVVLSRQRWVWREPHVELPRARRWVATLLPIIAASGVALLYRWELWWFIAFSIGAVVMTAYAVWMTVHNRQRSVWLQIASSFGLTSSGMAGALALTNEGTQWAWWLWLLSAAQAAAGILVVHARLEARVAARTRNPESTSSFRAAVAAQVLLVPLAILAWRVSPWLTAAMLLPAAVHAYELRTLRSSKALATPLRTIGFRAMGLSIAVSVLLIIGLR